MVTVKGDEKIIYEGKACWASYWISILVGILTLPMIIGVFVLVSVYLRRMSTEYLITDKRIYCQYGLVSRVIRDTTHDKVQDTSISQDILGRILNFGDLRFNTAGGANYEIQFVGVSDPVGVREYIKDIKK